MRHAAVVLILVVIAAGSSLAIAQEEPAPTPTQVDLFAWATGDSIDWGMGGLLALLGLVGSLVTVFTVVGGAIPGTAGKAKLDAESLRLEQFYDQLQRLISAPSPEAAAIAAVNTTVNQLRDDLRSERWRQFTIGAFLYAVLGAVFAAALAQQLLQALIIGAGWTGFVGAFGIRSNYEERKRVVNQSLDDVQEVLGALQTDPNASVAPPGSPQSAAVRPETVREVARKVAIARQM